MNILRWALALPLAACGAADLDAEAPSGATQPIVYGSTSPEVVDLEVREVNAIGAIVSSYGGGNYCTATAIMPNAAVTAAHCVYDSWSGDTVSPYSIGLALGSDARDPTAVREPSEIHMHPNYADGDDARYDIAVLVFDEPLPGVTPIPANCEPLTAAVLGEWVQTVGYGETEVSSYNSTRYWASEELVAVTSFDLTVDGHGEAGVCFGDSGGPALWTMPDGIVRVLGVLSWGDTDCGQQDHFARVDHECDFLTSVLGELDDGSAARARLLVRSFDGGEDGCAAVGPSWWSLLVLLGLARRRR